MRLTADDDAMIQRVNADIIAGQWMYLFTVCVGYLVFQVLGHVFPMDWQIDLGAQHDEIMKRIWPVQSDVSWPPKYSIEVSVGGIDALHDAFILDTLE